MGSFGDGFQGCGLAGLLAFQLARQLCDVRGRYRVELLAETQALAVEIGLLALRLIQTVVVESPLRGDIAQRSVDSIHRRADSGIVLHRGDEVVKRLEHIPCGVSQAENLRTGQVDLQLVTGADGHFVGIRVAGIADPRRLGGIEYERRRGCSAGKNILALVGGIAEAEKLRLDSGQFGRDIGEFRNRKCSAGSLNS